MRDTDDEDFQKTLPDFDLLQAIEAGLEALKEDEVHSFSDKVAGPWTYDQLIAVLRRDSGT